MGLPRSSTGLKLNGKLLRSTLIQFVLWGATALNLAGIAGYVVASITAYFLFFPPFFLAYTALFVFEGMAATMLLASALSGAKNAKFLLDAIGVGLCVIAMGAGVVYIALTTTVAWRCPLDITQSTAESALICNQSGNWSIAFWAVAIVIVLVNPALGALAHFVSLMNTWSAKTIMAKFINRR